MRPGSSLVPDTVSEVLFKCIYPSLKIAIAFPSQLQTPSVDTSSEITHLIGGSPLRTSDLVVMIVEVDVPGSQPIAPHKLIVARRPLIFCVARQHTLQAHTHALDILYRAPALLAE